MFTKPGQIETVKKVEEGYLVRVFLKMGKLKWAKTNKKFKVGDKVQVTLDRFNREIKNIFVKEDLIEHEPENEGLPLHPENEDLEDDYGATIE